VLAYLNVCGKVFFIVGSIEKIHWNQAIWLAISCCS